MINPNKDMYRKHWSAYHLAVCSIELLGKTNSRILGLTGFRFDSFIVSDDQVFNDKDCRKVVIRFYEDDGVTTAKKIELNYPEFLSRIPEKKHFDGLGFAYIHLTKDELEGTTSVALCNSCDSAIGREAFTICYNFEQQNIGLRTALISSNYINENKLHFLQFDGTVKPGTSGSPIFDFETGLVIGIVANKELSVVKMYREIIFNIDKNLEALDKARDKWFVDEVDPIQVLIANQNQLKHLSRTFFSNFALKGGYALDINHLKDHMDTYAEPDFDDLKDML